MFKHKSFKNLVMMVVGLITLLGSQLSFAESQRQLPEFDLSRFGDFMKEQDRTPMSRPSDNEKTKWTDASCQQACLNAGCSSYQYIGSAGGGSCTCSNCGG